MEMQSELSKPTDGEGREQTIIGWQNGLLDYDSIYDYLVVSKLLYFHSPTA